MAENRTLVVPAARVDAVARILRRSIATDTAEVRRLMVLGTAYHDRPAGSGVDAELELAKRLRDAAEDLLAQLLR
jgi:hypothetical protein